MSYLKSTPTDVKYIFNHNVFSIRYFGWNPSNNMKIWEHTGMIQIKYPFLIRTAIISLTRSYSPHTLFVAVELGIVGVYFPILVSVEII